MVAVVTDPQLNVELVADEDAVMVSVVLMQFNTDGVEMLTVGATMFCATVAEAVLVQPFAGSVTVTVNVPGEETVLVVVVMPPPQLNVAPAVVDEADKASLVFTHVKVAGGAIATLGTVMFWITVTEVVLLHPLDGSVTVTI